MAGKIANPLFDYALYGLLVRKGRIDMGFKKAEDFSEAVWRRTRVRITKDMLYKIEQGRQVPDTTQFMALNLVLSGTPFNEQLSSMCFSVECRHIIESRSIPDEWRVENTQRAWAEAFGVEAFEDMKAMTPDDDWLRFYYGSAQELADDNAALFDSGADQEWRTFIDETFQEIYGPDTTTWPRPGED